MTHIPIDFKLNSSIQFNYSAGFKLLAPRVKSTEFSSLFQSIPVINTDSMKASSQMSDSSAEIQSLGQYSDPRQGSDCLNGGHIERQETKENAYIDIIRLPDHRGSQQSQPRIVSSSVTELKIPRIIGHEKTSGQCRESSFENKSSSISKGMQLPMRPSTRANGLDSVPTVIPVSVTRVMSTRIQNARKRLPVILPPIQTAQNNNNSVQGDQGSRLSADTGISLSTTVLRFIPNDTCDGNDGKSHANLVAGDKYERFKQIFPSPPQMYSISNLLLKAEGSKPLLKANSVANS